MNAHNNSISCLCSKDLSESYIVRHRFISMGKGLSVTLIVSSRDCVSETVSESVNASGCVYVWCGVGNRTMDSRLGWPDPLTVVNTICASSITLVSRS